MFPCGQTRREFVWQMGGGFAGLALTDLLSRDSFFSSRASASEAMSTKVQRLAHHRGAKACIFLMMNGAPSQVDTFDYKPALEKYAGKSLPTDKKYINSGGRKVGYLTPAFRPFRPGGKSGLLISDYFPNVRKHADKLCVLNSCHTDSHAHGSALVAMNTGKTLIGRPSLGSWCAYGLGSDNDSLPGYVVILDKRGGPVSGQPNWSNGFMPATYSGTLFRPVGEPILDLKGPISRRQQREQLDLLAQLNRKHLAQRPGGSELQSRIDSYELAFRMQSAGRSPWIFPKKRHPHWKCMVLAKNRPTNSHGIVSSLADSSSEACGSSSFIRAAAISKKLGTPTRVLSQTTVSMPRKLTNRLRPCSATWNNAACSTKRSSSGVANLVVCHLAKAKTLRAAITIPMDLACGWLAAV